LEWSTRCLLHKKGNLTIIDNYIHIALLNDLLKLWTALIKDAGSVYGEAHGVLSDQQDEFRHLRSILEALASLITMMEDAKIHNKDVYHASGFADDLSLATVTLVTSKFN
jgi:hypothetical protein